MTRTLCIYKQNTCNGILGVDSVYDKFASVYRILPSKCPWALEIHGPKNGGGRLHGEAFCTDNLYTREP